SRAPAHKASWPRSAAYASRVRAAEPRRRRSASSNASASTHAGLMRGASSLASVAVGVFFIDTSTGTVATQRQLIDAGLATTISAPPRPWLEIRATGDASTMWYEVLRKRERG